LTPVPLCFSEATGETKTFLTDLFCLETALTMNTATPQRSKSNVKNALLTVALIWSVVSALLTLAIYRQTLAESIPADEPGFYFVRVPTYEASGVLADAMRTNRDRMSSQTIAGRSAVKVLTWTTPVWAFVLVFLLGRWFATK
jgi:hypothetical protein